MNKRYYIRLNDNLSSEEALKLNTKYINSGVDYIIKPNGDSTSWSSSFRASWIAMNQIVPKDKEVTDIVDDSGESIHEDYKIKFYGTREKPMIKVYHETRFLLYWMDGIWNICYLDGPSEEDKKKILEFSKKLLGCGLKS